MRLAREVLPPVGMLTPPITSKEYDIIDDVPISLAVQTYQAASSPDNLLAFPSSSSNGLLDSTLDIDMGGLDDDLGLADRFLEDGLHTAFLSDTFQDIPNSHHVSSTSFTTAKLGDLAIIPGEMPHNQAMLAGSAAYGSALPLSSDSSTTYRFQVEPHSGPTSTNATDTMLSPKGLILDCSKKLAANRPDVLQRAKWITDKLLARTHQTFETSQRELGTTKFDSSLVVARDLVQGWSTLLITGPKLNKIRSKACLIEPEGPILFLERNLFTAILDSTHPVEFADIHYRNRHLLAQALTIWPTRNHFSGRQRQASELAASVFKLYEAVMRERDDIFKFLALVTLAQLAHTTNLQILPTILAIAVSTLQSLHLFTESGISDISTEPSHINMVKRASWLLFYIDMTSAMRWKTFPLLPESIISYEIPKGMSPKLPSYTQDANHLGIMVQYAKLCARINRQSLGSAPSSDTLSVLLLLDELRSWYRSVPGTGDGPNDPLVFTRKEGSEDQLSLTRYFQFHEALLMIEDLADKQAFSFSALAPEMHRMSRLHEVCQAVRHAPNIFGDSTFLYVPTKAFCYIALEGLRSSKDSDSQLISQTNTALVDLSLAFGYLGQNAHAWSSPKFFDMASELMGTVLLSRL